MYQGLKSIKEAIEAAQKRVRNEGQEALKGAFQELFAAEPRLEGIQWTQYTPYFNDGDTCTFSVGEAEVLIKSEGDGGSEEYQYSDYYLKGEAKKTFQEVKEKVDELFGFLDADIMLAVFGDHVQVTANAEGFNVEEYSHD